MPAVDRVHSPTPESLMAFLDGESPAQERAAIEAHVADCVECRRVMQDLRGVSQAMTSWDADAAPATLRPPRAEAPARLLRLPAISWRPSYVVLTFGGVAVTLMLVANLVPYAKRARLLEARHSPTVAGAMPDGIVREHNGPLDGRIAGRGGAGNGKAPVALAESKASKGPGDTLTVAQTAGRSLIRTATLRLVARDFDAVRPAVERLAADTGGFVDQMSAAGTPGTPRTLTGTIRVPSDRLSQALARLRQLGQVTEDTQGAEDVTDQIVDLDARLANARATEQRLTDILRTRTGKLSDVLDVERELARVRLEIEQMDAQRANVGRRVTYASIAIDISEERKAGLDGPLPLMTRLRIAAADGVQSAVDTVVGAVLLVVRAGPTLLLWLLAGTAAWATVRRLQVRGQTPRHP